MIPTCAFKLLRVVLVAAVSTVVLAVNGSAQVAAPTALPQCLIQFNNPSVLESYSWLILFNSDHTYQEVNSYYSAPGGSGTSTRNAKTL